MISHLQPRCRSSAKRVLSLIVATWACIGLLGGSVAAKPHHGPKHFTPKPGTYVGIGTAKSGGHTYPMRILLHFDQDTVHDIFLEYSFPGCSVGAGGGSGPVEKKAFKLVSSQGNGLLTRVLRGRFTSATALKGSLKLVYQGPLTCGQPGTYVYDWTGKRTGKP